MLMMKKCSMCVIAAYCGALPEGGLPGWKAHRGQGTGLKVRVTTLRAVIISDVGVAATPSPQRKLSGSRAEWQLYSCQGGGAALPNDRRRTFLTCLVDTSTKGSDQYKRCFHKPKDSPLTKLE